MCFNRCPRITAGWFCLGCRVEPDLNDRSAGRSNHLYVRHSEPIASFCCYIYSTTMPVGGILNASLEEGSLIVLTTPFASDLRKISCRLSPCPPRHPDRA